MSKAGLNIQLKVQDIYNCVCKECKTKIRELIKERITDEMVTQVIGDKQ